MQYIVYVEAEKSGKYMMPQHDYRIQCSNAGIAARRAYTQYRKDVPKTRFGTVNIKVIPA